MKSLPSASRKISLVAALFILIAVPITVVAGLNYNPVLTRASACYDVTGEGLVDGDDSEEISNLSAANLYKKEADVDSDGLVGQADKEIVDNHHNEVCEPEVTFFADPKTIKADGTTTLRWSVKHAETVSISTTGAVANEGEMQVSPNGNTTYTLRVTSPAGTVTASTKVEIEP